ncbi:hypothetical protein BRADI_1g30820v3 [Brachypodium distachyon]|uniref:Response regulatory domain-containing protein n=1 Tax=Brachypodium distachyon TaxID=15368 RepID=A0A0Q3H2J1_BRADI|nr:hypothetical protein BRADI_1g30820v3 [Brachypodium distachyon]
MAAKKDLCRGMRVLAIDEDRVCLKTLEAKLRRCNHHVIPAKDGKTALRALGKTREPFDVVITELYVPDMDACELIRKIDGEMGIPVIVVSAYEDTMTVRKGLSSGACCYLAKPACADQLKMIWQHVLRRKNELARNHKSSGNIVADQRVQTGIAEAEQGAKCTMKNLTFASSSSKNLFVTPSIQPGTVKHGSSTLKDVLSPLPGESHRSKDFAKALSGLIVNTNQGKAFSYLDGEMVRGLNNQFTSFASASSGHIQTVLNGLQNQQVPNPMAALISNTTPLAGFNQQMAPASNTSSVEMFFNGKVAPSGTSRMSFPSLQTSNCVTPTPMVNDLSNSSAFPNIEASSFVLPTEMLNGGDAVPNIQPGNYITLDQIVNGLRSSSALPNNEANSFVLPTEMLNDADAGSNIQTGNYITLDQIVNGLRNSSALPNIEAESSVVLAQMLNGGDAVGMLPAQEGTADQQVLDGQLNNNDDFSWDYIDVDMFDQNFIEDDALLNHSIEDGGLLMNSEGDALLKSFFEDDDFLKNSIGDDDFLQNSIGDDDLLKNSTEDDALLNNFSEVDDLLNGDWF